MADVIGFQGIPAPRRHLAKQLRELADVIETDQSETEPHGIMMCLMGAYQFEVFGIGDTEGWTGARQAMHSVLGATYETAGGNVRVRNHPVYQPRPTADLTYLVVKQKS